VTRHPFRLPALSLAITLIAAVAANATPSGLFGNTLQITGPDGGVSKVYVNADGTYSRTDPSGNSTSGSWAETDGQMCFTQQAPTQGSALCGPLITHAVGDNWTGNRPDGSVSQLTIILGR
jgi:hypothetical protein